MAFPAICLSGAQKPPSDGNNAGLTVEEAAVGQPRMGPQDGAPGAMLLPAKKSSSQMAPRECGNSHTPGPRLQTTLHISRDTEQKVPNMTVSYQMCT